MLFRQRRTTWLGALILLPVCVSAALFSPHSRINRRNLEQIRNGMYENEVIPVLGAVDEDQFGILRIQLGGSSLYARSWSDGPNWIRVCFRNDRVFEKHIHLASPWETVAWCLKRAAATFGMKVQTEHPYKRTLGNPPD
jgi:hypothetical protein